MELEKFIEEMSQKLRPKNNMSEFIVSTLKEAIFTGVLPQGSRLIEEQLAKLLNVSKTPLREALNILQKEGLIVSVPYQGKTVASISPAKIIEAYTVRKEVEKLAVRAAMRNITEAAVEQLEKYTEMTERFAREGNHHMFLRYDYEFHRLIFKLADSDILTDVYELISNRIRLGQVATAFRCLRLTESAREHREILEAIKSGDGQRAEEAMCRHINNLTKSVEKLLEE